MEHGPGVCILRAFIMRLLQDRNVSSSCKLTPKLSMSSHNLLSPRCWGRKEWLGWHGRLEGPDDQEERDRVLRVDYFLFAVEEIRTHAWLACSILLSGASSSSSLISQGLLLPRSGTELVGIMWYDCTNESWPNYSLAIWICRSGTCALASTCRGNQQL